MTETARLGLPLVEAAQAQKHVTVNEAFARLDALTGLVVESVGTTAPPPAPAEGAVYAVGAGASGDWAGADGFLALWLNNGWEFLSPGVGWRAWDVAAGHIVTFDGTGWVGGVAAFGPQGSALVHEVIEVDHTVGSGSVSTVSGALPDGALIFGVSARVLSAVGGSGSIDLGVSGASGRYGQGLGVAAGSTLADIREAPVAYPGGGDLVLTASGGAFNGTGSVRLAVHVARIEAPRA